MLPDGDGLALCQKIRQISIVPILLVTSKSGDLDLLQGFHLGADDYLTLHTAKAVGFLGTPVYGQDIFQD
jgi:DNA-binding response OmpR family regulator